MSSVGTGLEAVDSRPRCPLAGASSMDIRRCPGFAEERVLAGDVEGSEEAYATCAHLSAETDDRGYFPACHHPEAAWIVHTATLMAQTEEIRAEMALRCVHVLADRVDVAHTGR